jgi:hypothetical protein
VTTAFDEERRRSSPRPRARALAVAICALSAGACGSSDAPSTADVNADVVRQANKAILKDTRSVRGRGVKVVPRTTSDCKPTGSGSAYECALAVSARATAPGEKTIQSDTVHGKVRAIASDNGGQVVVKGLHALLHRPATPAQGADIDAKSATRETVVVLEECFTDKTDYRPCARAAFVRKGLRSLKVRADLVASVETSATEDGYTIAARSKTGNVFKIVRENAGRVVRRCTRAGLFGCPRSGRW